MSEVPRKLTIDELQGLLVRMMDLHIIAVGVEGQASSATCVARLRDMGKHDDADELARLLALTESFGATRQ
ncbi:MAG: hypothetical protein JNK40_12055 [Chromatiales bacterium]|nr:hypothetical protein [Chromatiales bacterium]